MPQRRRIQGNLINIFTKKSLNRKKLYIFILVLSFAGYLWIAYLIHYDLTGEIENNSINTCVFKYMTGLPCPSCGMSRSVISVFQARFKDALYLNPLGYIMTLAMIVFPVWITMDLFVNKSTFLKFYESIENYFKNKWIAYPFILIILVLWVWNIYKFT